MLTPENIAWFAGLFEGEGTISRCRPNESSAWRMSLRMTDEDIIRRIAALLGGAVYENNDRRKLGHKMAWSWQLGSQDEIKRIVDMIYPYMGQRRAAKMREFYEYYAKPRLTQGERSKKGWANPETYARQCAIRKARWADPIWKAAQLERMNAARSGGRWRTPSVGA